LKFKGRILTLFIVFLVNLLYTTFYYMRDGYVSWIEFIGYVVLLPLAWWFGKQYDKVQFFSEKDPLTGIYNRRYIENIFPKLKDSQENQFAVLLIDVNDFKIINDILGHKSGDEYLKNMTMQLEKSAGKKDILGRWGGDEFIILSKSSQSKEMVGRIMDEVHANLKKISAGDLEIGVSIGAALYPNEGKTLDELLRIADKKMYHRKSQKKECSQSYR
jgi:diguanylate cyclase (GGDEF)-like protein